MVCSSSVRTKNYKVVPKSLYFFDFRVQRYLQTGRFSNRGDGPILGPCGWRGARRRGFLVLVAATPRSWSGDPTRGCWAICLCGCGAKVFPSESSALRRQWRRCLWVSLPSWGRYCGYLRHVRASGENLWPSRSRCRRRATSLPSWGRHRGAPSLGIVPVTSVASLALPVLLFSIFDLLCKRFPSSLCIGSAVGLYL